MRLQWQQRFRRFRKSPGSAGNTKSLDSGGYSERGSEGYIKSLGSTSNSMSLDSGGYSKSLG